jgi:hypothetical protein
MLIPVFHVLLHINSASGYLVFDNITKFALSKKSIRGYKIGHYEIPLQYFSWIIDTNATEGTHVDQIKGKSPRTICVYLVRIQLIQFI